MERAGGEGRGQVSSVRKVASLPEQQFLAWGWRIPFLLSIVLVGVGLFIRLRIMESPAFNRVKESQIEARMPIVGVLPTYPKSRCCSPRSPSSALTWRRSPTGST